MELFAIEKLFFGFFSNISHASFETKCKTAVFLFLISVLDIADFSSSVHMLKIASVSAPSIWVKIPIFPSGAGRGGEARLLAVFSTALQHLQRLRAAPLVISRAAASTPSTPSFQCHPSPGLGEHIISVERLLERPS